MKPNACIPEITGGTASRAGQERLITPGIWRADFDENGLRTFLEYDASVYHLLGFSSREEYERISGTWDSPVHPEDCGKLDSQISDCTAKHPEGMDYDIEYRVRTKDGFRWVHDHAHIIRREDGSPVHADGLVFDIQEIVDREAEHRRFAENYDRVLALEDGFQALYDLELDTGRYEILVQDRHFGEDLDEPVFSNDFYKDLQKNVMAVHPEDRKRNLDAMTPALIRDSLSKDDHFDVYFRLMVKEKPVWTRMRVVYKNSEKKNVIIGIFNAEHETEAKQITEQKAQLASQHDRLNESLAFTNFFLDTYVSAYYIDLKNLSYLIYKQTEELKSNYPNIGNYVESVHAYISRDVHPDDRAGLTEILSPDYLRSALKKTPGYSMLFRDISGGTEKNYKVQIIRGADEDHAAFGFTDVTEELREQQRHLLGAVPLSSDILTKANIGLWAFELDEGRAPRMYADEAMLGLIGLEHQVSPEETYHAWYDHIDEGSYDLVADAVAKMTAGEHAEVQYPWHHPGGDTWIVRCGGVRNYDYTKGIRIEGTHQNVTQLFHFDVKMKRKEKEMLFNYFIDSYDSAYFVDLAHDTLEILHMDESLANVFGRQGERLEDMLRFIEEHIHPDDRAMMRQMIDKDYVRGRLKTENAVTFTVREVFGGLEKTLRGQIIRGTDEDHVAVGFMNITAEAMEQRKRLLGAIPLSSDILTKANIGLWAFELDEGRAPRMYADEAMLGLIGLEHQVSPEETYHAWYDHIDEGSYDLVADAVAKMTAGEHAEVQYPWHHPNGNTWIVRCGGVRNFDYKTGIRIEGTHQNVSEVFHFDEKERKRAKQLEYDLLMAKLQADSLAYISDHEPNLDKAVSFLGERILEVTGCDLVIFREMDGHRIVFKAPGVEDTPAETCAGCPFTDLHHPVFSVDDMVLMDRCGEGCHGFLPNPDCPAKSSFMKRIYSGGQLVGLFTIHYLRKQHTFSESGIATLQNVAVYLGLMIGRIKEKQAEIARIEAESSNKAKTEFLFNMSHDIRTPMNAILGYTDIAMNHLDEKDRVRDSLKKIKASGGHLLKLINDILEMSRIEAGKMEITTAPLNVNEAAENVVHMSQALATGKDINFTAKIENLRNPYIYADELHTNQILVNVISNAIKYTNPGGTVSYHIEQISDPQDGIAWYRVTVADNGIGMSEAFQEHLFESFSREQTATVSKREGSGLGLAIVKRIMDLIGGRITVHSKLGEGSTFILEIPFEVMDDEAVAAYTASRVEEQELHIPASVDHVRILLVEDNEMNREIATEILDEAGFTVETAEDGAIAVRRVREKGAGYYQFILMDIQMPVMNGYEATAEIRKLPDGDGIPIIALSANAFREDVERSIAAGMNAHVSKPIKIRELLETIEKFR